VASRPEVAAGAAGLDLGRVSLGAAVGLGLAVIAFDSGGYFPTAWSWGALVALVVVAGALVLGDAARPSSLALASFGGLAGFTAWTWVALLWSNDRAATVLEGQRALLYLAVLAALVLLVRRATVPLVLAAGLVGIFLVSGYGLLTRLFPERLGVFDPIAAAAARNAPPEEVALYGPLSENGLAAAPVEADPQAAPADTDLPEPPAEGVTDDAPGN
jgi:hypothetical protein